MDYPDWQTQAKTTHEAIKAYYLRHNGQHWPKVAANPQLFNQVWRRMLRLPADDKPPPKQYRCRSTYFPDPP